MEKLTPKQNAVIWCLQNGWQIITDCDMKGAEICNEKMQYHINNGLFFKLVEKGLIFQNASAGHWYTLTDKGKSIITKPVEINHS